MKKILTFISLLFLGLTSQTIAMQEPTTATGQITYGKLHRTTNHLKICALFNGTKIGSIKFKEEEAHDWYLAKLSVDKGYRKTNNKVGFTLFSKCLAHINSKNPRRIHWFVTCIKDDSPNIKTLIAIYQRMISKLKLDKKLTIEEYDTTAFMALGFNHE